jgi:hypothetical protein
VIAFYREVGCSSKTDMTSGARDSTMSQTSGFRKYYTTSLCMSEILGSCFCSPQVGQFCVLELNAEVLRAWFEISFVCNPHNARRFNQCVTRDSRGATFTCSLQERCCNNFTGPYVPIAGKSFVASNNTLESRKAEREASLFYHTTPPKLAILIHAK